MSLRPALAGPVIAALALVLTHAGASPAQAAGQRGDLVRVVLKFVRSRADPPSEPVRLRADSCRACVQRYDADYVRENRRETIVELDVPRGRSLEPVFDTAPKAFRRVVLQSGDAPFEEGPDGAVLVQLPPIEDEAVEAAEFATHIVGPGYVLRFEHADKERRAGAYADVFPATERAAADNLVFAEREAMLELGLGLTVRDDQLGVVELMGFDTNNPHGHRDAPPHVHMHLRWPYNAGTQIGHLYLNPQGRLSMIRAGVSGIRRQTLDFSPGEVFENVGPKGEPVYALTVTTNGGLTLRTRQGSACAISPLGQGFDAGARVACDGRPEAPIHVHDDLAAGLIRVATGNILEVFRYDRDTGRLLSPTRSPPHEPSAVLPRFELRGLPDGAGPVDP